MNLIAVPSDKKKSVSQPRFIPSFLQTGRLQTSFYVSPTFYPAMDAFAVIINILIIIPVGSPGSQGKFDCGLQLLSNGLQAPELMFCKPFLFGRLLWKILLLSLF